jgi:hypothetical protein
VIDPDGTIGKGERVSADIYPHPLDSQTSFSVRWTTSEMDLITMAVRASDGAVIDVTGDAVTGYDRGPTFAVLSLDLDRLRASDPAKLGHTAWRLELTGNTVPDGAREAYAYSVFSTTTLKMKAAVDTPSPLAAGATPVLTATVTANSAPVPGLTDAYVQVIGPDPSSPVYQALHDDGLPPDAARDDGVYSATLGPFGQAGAYAAKVRVMGFNDGWVQREDSLNLQVGSGN